MRAAFLSVLAFASGLGGCRTTVDDAPVGLDLAKPIVLEVQRLWRVMDGGELAGIVVLFGAPEAAEDARRHYYSVRNGLQQELGTIDGLGRAWRFEPHQSTPRFLGTGSVLDGARAILGASEDATLAEAQVTRR